MKRTNKAPVNKYIEIAAKMSDAELRHAHKDVSDVFELAAKDGRNLSQKHWDELQAYQAESGRRHAPRLRAEMEEQARRNAPSTVHLVCQETVGGQDPTRLSFAIRCF